MLKKLIKKTINNKYILFICFLLNYNIAQALELKGNFIQGGLVIGKTETTAKVYLNNINIPVDDEGEFLLQVYEEREPMLYHGSRPQSRHLESRPIKRQVYVDPRGDIDQRSHVKIL